MSRVQNIPVPISTIINEELLCYTISPPDAIMFFGGINRQGPDYAISQMDTSICTPSDFADISSLAIASFCGIANSADMKNYYVLYTTGVSNAVRIATVLRSNQTITNDIDLSPGFINDVTAFSSLELNPVDRKLYTLFPIASDSYRIYEVNPITGVVALYGMVSGVPAPAIANGLGSGLAITKDNRWFLITNDNTTGGDSELYELDSTTLAAIAGPFIPQPNQTLGALSSLPIGTLVALSGQDNATYELNPDDGTILGTICSSVVGSSEDIAVITNSQYAADTEIPFVRRYTTRGGVVTVQDRDINGNIIDTVVDAHNCCCAVETNEVTSGIGIFNYQDYDSVTDTIAEGFQSVSIFNGGPADGTVNGITLFQNQEISFEGYFAADLNRMIYTPAIEIDASSTIFYVVTFV